jgi:NADH dehydrogenase
LFSIAIRTGVYVKMPPQIVVLGAGYAGASAIRSLETELEHADLVWISEESYHFVLHETHRCIRNPEIRHEITIPIHEIKSEQTRFVQETVTALDIDDREIILDNDQIIDYDYAVIAIGSQTAFFDIDGLEANALTLKSRNDALSIHRQVRDAAREASSSDPAQVVVGGAGLTGIQTAGEIAAWRDETDTPLEIHLVEMEEHVFPGHAAEFQGALRRELEAANIDIHTDTTCTEVDEGTMYFAEREEMAYDVLVWAGGVTGRDALEEVNLETDHNRAYADSTFKTSDNRVYAIGDTALVDQALDEGPVSEQIIWQCIVNPDPDTVPPPTAEAAMEEGKQLGENIARLCRDDEPADWTYIDKGTLVSVGDAAVAHDVVGIPIDTFSGPVARTLKRAISARWIAQISTPGRAVAAWPDM